MLNDYFRLALSDLKCNNITKSYIIGIFDKYKSSNYDLSDQNITLTYIDGIFNNDFEKIQNLADWIFFLKSLYPAFLKNASSDYYNNIAQLSYYRCYKMMHTWQVYEQLADEFVILTYNTRELLLK